MRDHIPGKRGIREGGGSKNRQQGENPGGGKLSAKVIFVAWLFKARSTTVETVVKSVCRQRDEDRASGGKMKKLARKKMKREVYSGLGYLRAG